MDNIFSLIQAFMGVYLLYCAAFGKGKVLENDYLKVPREEYRKRMRLLSGVSGFILALGGGLTALGAVSPASVLGWILWGLGLASIIPMMVYSSKCTDKDAAAAGRATDNSNPQTKKEDPLRAAFVFDEEEEAAPSTDDPAGNGKS